MPRRVTVRTVNGAIPHGGGGPFGPSLFVVTTRAFRRPVEFLILLLLMGRNELQGQQCPSPWSSTRWVRYSGPGCGGGSPFGIDSPCAVGDEITFSYGLVACEYATWRFFIDGVWFPQNQPGNNESPKWTFTKPGRYVAEVTVSPGPPYDVYSRGVSVEVVHAFHVIGPTTVGEKDGAATFTVRRSKSPGAASIDYATVDGTAKSGLHYQAMSGTLAFAANEWEKSVSVPLIDDTVFTDGSFGLTFSNATAGYRILGAAEGDPYTASTYILDDEPVPVVSLVFSALEYPVDETAGKVAVTVLKSGDAVPVSVSVVTRYPTTEFFRITPGRVAFAANETSKTVELVFPPDENCFRRTEYLVPLYMDLPWGPRLVVENAGTTVLRIRDKESRPELALGNDIEVQEGQSGVSTYWFDVRLSAPLCYTLRLDSQVLNGTANWEDYGHNTRHPSIAKGAIEGSVGFFINGDRIAEPDETFQLSLSGFRENNQLEPPIAVRTTATCTILNDDAPPPPPATSLLDGNPGVPGSDVRFGVEFASPVTGVDLSDFELVETNLSGSSLTSVTGADASWVVTARLGTPSNQSGPGTVGLRVLDDDTIIDEHRNPLGGAGAGNGTFIAPDAYHVTHATTIPLLEPVMLALLALALAAAALRGAIR